MNRPGIITFDCYGTLIDWERGITEAFVGAARAGGVTIDSGAVVSLYAAVEPGIESEGYQTYREVLTECALLVSERLGWSLERPEASFLAESLPSWTAFADTAAALRSLRAGGVSLAILSNTDRDLFASTRHQLDVEFDFVITAEDVRSYKPAFAHFLAARERIGSSPWMHAGASIFHDVAPTRCLGIPSAWINRKGEPMPERPEKQPDLVYSNLAALADAVLGL